MNESIDPECALAFAYAPAQARAALTLLWRLDATLGRIVGAAREPVLAAIKLTWWRDALTALDGAPPPAEPVLREIVAALLPIGVGGAALAALASDWTDMLTETDEATRLRHAARRGARLFTFATSILGGSQTTDVGAAGEGWGLVDYARRRGALEKTGAALEAARARLHHAPDRWPGALRPIGMLAVLARTDARALSTSRQGSPARLLRMAVHRLTGT